MPINSLERFRYWGGVLSGRRVTQDQAHERYRRIMQTLASAALGRGVGFVVSFVSVPLTVKYLGGERYGLWVSISTLLGWFAMGDLGLANTLTNHLSTSLAHGHRKEAQQYVATTFWLLASIAALIAVLFLIVWPWIDWRGLFNVRGTTAQHEVAAAVGTAVLLVVASLPFLVNNKVLYACQEGTLANYWTAAGNAVSLMMICVVVHFKLGLPWLILAVSGTTLGISTFTSIWLFGIHRSELRPIWTAVDRFRIKSLGMASSQFFVIQIAVLLIFQSDNLIITHFLGAAQVTPYAVCFKVFSYVTLAQSLALPALWPAYAEAIARRDGRWVQRTFWIVSVASGTSAAILIVPLIVYGRQIICWWAGSAAVPPQLLLYWMAAWTILISVGNSIGCLLNGAGQIRGQTIYGTTTAVISVILACTLVVRYGIVGVLMATTSTFFFFNFLPASIETRYLLHRLAAN